MEQEMTKVEAISLEGYQFRSEDFCFKDDRFKNLPNLRILLLDRASLSGNFEGILPNLRWLSWHFCNFSPKLPTNLNLKNLIVLDISRSMVSEDWAGWSLMKVAAKLKVLALTECRHLTRTPSFSAFPALEKLILRSCRKLVSVDPSIEQLSALVSLDIRDCMELEYLPQLGSTDTLTELLVDYEVFLSFRGLDDSEGFTDRLYHHLKDAGVHTLRDDGKLRVVEEIEPELMMAIKQSKIYIPILSKGYATWCLKEVAEMMKLEDETKHMIMPIFLDVMPDEVKKHGELIKKVLARVINCLKKAYLDVNDILVGIDDHVEAVKTLLELGKEVTQELKNRLRDKKVIILLDDVDEVDQLKALAGDLAWFGPRSRIIVTIREKTVLDLFRIKNIYELTRLSEYQAFELFCKHAFKEHSPTPDFVLGYCEDNWKLPSGS
ncbi:hypothetical protein CRG98_019462 [Punica granatum]|uniref:TIR domain-containing protein n=1 Tax=Punica granatum TaxID=22663 RepID=A0A2I0JUY1_PUNGR|nr:hypothetical protein CRG98_019462 [Punica granatum]